MCIFIAMYMNLRVSVYLHLCMIIYTVIVHTMLISYANYMMLGVLVMCVRYTVKENEEG